MLHKYVNEIAEIIGANLMPEKKVLNIARQNSDGVQILNEAYAGIDTNAKHSAYISYNDSNDVVLTPSKQQSTSLRNSYDGKSVFKFVHWHKVKNELEYGQYLLQFFHKISSQYSSYPLVLSTDTENIFKAETTGEKALRTDINLIKITFEVNTKLQLNDCIKFKEEGCNGGC
jgi:hypothetical protein